MVGIADALRDHADPNVPIVDQPSLLLGIWIKAAALKRRK
jgi:hypothetical protein